MGWFTDVLDFVGLDNDTLSGVARVGAVVAPVAGAVISSNANKAAAKTAAEAADRQAAEIRAGRDAATARFDTIYEDTAPARSRLLQLTAADPTMLSPSQRITLEDTLRDGSARLATSGLRGAGRAGTAAINDLQRRTTASLIGDNMTRGDAAARTLAQEGLSAARGAGSIDYQSGVQLSGVEGRDAATQAGFEVAQGRNLASTIGQIQAAIASDVKEQGRRSRYPSTQGTVTTAPAGRV